MPFPQHFIVEGKHLGTAQRGLYRVHEDLRVPSSYAFFCPVCAEVWARCPVELPGGTCKPFMVLTRACRKHPTTTLGAAGELYLDWDQDFSNSFPESVWIWEFQRNIEG